MSRLLYVMQRLSPDQKAQVAAAARPMAVEFADQCSPQDQAEALARATAILGEPTMEQVLRAERLQWIQMTWAGADRYVKDPTFPKGVLVSNATGAFGVSIAEYLLGAALALARKFPAYLRQQEQALWQPLPGALSLEGKTALILGVGDIGTALARRLKAFDVQTLGVRRTARPGPSYFDALHGLGDLDALLPRADLVFGCLPGTAETAGLLSASRLGLLKPSALVLNAGRGSLIDLDALADALESGRLRGAALDVTAPEPLPAAHRLWAMENVLLTPHVAGIGFGDIPETEEKIVAICCENLRRVAAGKVPTNLVDFQTGYRMPAL